jgi:hypothetical protein
VNKRSEEISHQRSYVNGKQAPWTDAQDSLSHNRDVNYNDNEISTMAMA